mmetsp:Transcript_13405/g.40529  ORF Transcript_13405/g.40529 Transcript_13405/m.40529 type:complete len:128 (+) Transcript_13405:188-571(+)
MRRAGGPKVVGVLVVICYLEVLLWSFILLSSCASASATNGGEAGYLLRETCNLKQVVRAEVNQELSGALDLRGAALDLQAERVSLLRLQEAQDPGRATFSLGSPLYLNLFPVTKGSPGPYTGVKAIT